MIKVLKQPYLVDENSICIGTHNGIFHCDEIIAISILDILYENSKSINVIRSRNLDLLSQKTNLLIDIGSGKFDHHQKGGNGKRENGIEYASSGLVWKEFGKDLVILLSEGKLNNESIEDLFNKIDNDLIQNIDKEDNGQNNTQHQFQFIKDFLPTWNSENINYDKNFEICINISSTILKNTIKTYISAYLAKVEIENRIKSIFTHIDNILVIPNQTIPWTDIIINYNKNNTINDNIDFVVFPYPDGGYALQCVPPSEDNLFSQRISLPEEWAGETINLSNISGIKTATFCHRGKFFARALEFGDIIKMCQLATNKQHNKKTLRRNL